MTSSLDEMYDEMLRGEFSSRGKHAAPDTGPALVEEPRPAGRHGLHAAPEAPLHAEFEIHEVQVREVQVRDETPPPAAAEGTSAESEGPRGLARYRNAAMVGAGGLACAAVGAFLGGLGGSFTISAGSGTPSGLLDCGGPVDGRRGRRRGAGYGGIDGRDGRGDHRRPVVAVGFADADGGAAAMADVGSRLDAGAGPPTWRT